MALQQALSQIRKDTALADVDTNKVNLQRHDVHLTLNTESGIKALSLHRDDSGDERNMFTLQARIVARAVRAFVMRQGNLFGHLE